MITYNSETILYTEETMFSNNSQAANGPLSNTLR